MSVDLAVLVASISASMLLAIIVLSRNPRAIVNRIFTFFSVSTMVWASFNYLADHGPAAEALLFTRLTFIASLGIAYAAVLLGFNFPTSFMARGRKLRRAFDILVLVNIVVAFTPGLVAGAVQKRTGATLVTGGLYPIFLLCVVSALALFVYGLRLQYRSATSVTQKSQIKLVLAGIVLYGVCASVANLVLPVLVDNWTSSRYGPIFTLITVSLIGYAIIRHRLFDIRMYAIRSLAYLLSAFAMALLYAIPAVLVTTYVLQTTLSVKALVALILITLVVAFFFRPVKDFFDNATKHLFYRDAYDPQELFNKFNKVLVSTVDVEQLLQKATGLIVTDLKSEFCVVGLERPGTTKIRTMGSGSSVIVGEDLVHGRHLLRSVKEFPVVTDMLEPQHHELKALLEKNNIAVLTPLFEHLDEELGYLLLGSKKSGGPYTDQDSKVVTTLANELSIAMQNALRFEEIEQFNATLRQKIDDATRQLRSTNQKLRTLDATKDEFITMASHQLRTPLTSVKGYLSMVLEGDAGKLNANQRKLLEQSYASSQRMVYLISDLLNLSRLNTGKFVIEPSPVNLSDVVQDEVDQLAETAKSRELALVYNRPANFPQLMLDETKIHQVVMNLIDNAIYYTPAGGTVTVALRETPTAVEYTVRDTGIGVPKAVQHKLFTKFYRAANAQQARPDGTGLGLFMAKKVVVAQGGSIIFESEQGKGSTFGFRFSKAGHAVSHTPQPGLQPATKQPVGR